MTILYKIEQLVTEIESEYQNSKGLILTEDDLKCHIFRKLYSLFDHNLETMDTNIKASPLHTEIYYFDENKKLKLRPDIAILNTKDLSILHSLEYKIDKLEAKFKRTSSKEFEYRGNSIIFELKFCRAKNGINRNHVKTYLKDIEKIKRLQELVNRNSNGINKINGIFIIFNKTDKKVPELDKLLTQSSDTLKILYHTGKVVFQNTMVIN